MVNTVHGPTEGVFGHAARPVARNLVSRERVFSALDQALETPVFVVCAPAGYGKSLAVSSWLDDRDLGTAAWANLARTGRSTVQLWTTVVDALRIALPGAADQMASVAALANRGSDEVPARLARWFGDLGQPLVVVLDDAQGLTGDEAHAQLVELLAGLPGDCHFVVVTRHDPPWPTQRMRLQGLLGELRADTLAFRDEEAVEMFSMLDIPLDAAAVSGVVGRTHGWAAGLRLTALGLSRAIDPVGYARSTSGGTGYIADYLFAEVYRDLPRDWQDFLTTISVVDQVCPPLAEALGAGHRSREMLAELARQNAFVHELDSPLGWYRVHPLLLDFLRSRVTDKNESATKHRLAAAWFIAQEQPLVALHHAMEAEDWETAADLTGSYVVTWTVRRAPRELLETLERVPREAVLTYPGLAVAMAAARTMAGESDVEDLLRAARDQLHRVNGRRRRRHEFIMHLVAVGTPRWTGGVESVLDGLREVSTDPAYLSSLGLIDWAAIRALLIGNVGSCELWTGDLANAREHLEMAASEDLGEQIVLPTLNAGAHLSYWHLVGGELAEADQIARRTLDALGDAGLSTAVQAATAYLALAGVAFDRGEDESARGWLELGESTMREPHVALAAAILRARLLSASGEAFEAAHVLDAAIDAAKAWTLPSSLMEHATTMRSTLDSSAPDTATGQQWGPDSGRFTPGGPFADSPRALLMRAVAEAIGGETEESRLEALEAALVVAAPEEFRRPFIDVQETMRPLLLQRMDRGTAAPEFAADLLSRLSLDPQTSPKNRYAVLVPLSEREMTVMRYLVTSMSVAEIADALFVSINTVKTHQRAIYQKLGAGNRREAVAHARELSLL